MPDPSKSTSSSQVAFCPACKEEFLVYASVWQPECPRCGARARFLGRRRLMSVVVVILLLAVVAAVAVYWFSR
ncbi:MAG: hypothetical protein ACYTFZ_02030 [Planctomycetota bacterium]|jgi:predicted RNA-binding Zn-ribbon protein involved in translation (DUF1610 family)